MLTDIYLIGAALHLILLDVVRADDVEMGELERHLVPFLFAVFWPIPASWALAAAIARRL